MCRHLLAPAEPAAEMTTDRSLTCVAAAGPLFAKGGKRVLDSVRDAWEAQVRGFQTAATRMTDVITKRVA